MVQALPGPKNAEFSYITAPDKVFFFFLQSNNGEIYFSSNRKMLIIFSFLYKNTCWYSLEAPQQGSSNE